MGDRPINCRAASVRSLLAGTKTQLREVLKLRGRRGFSEFGPSDTAGYDWHFRDAGMRWHDIRDARLKELLPYAPGDRLWVRESIGRRTASFLGIEATNGVEDAFYAADDEDVVNEHGFNLCPWWKQRQSLPSIHMPRWASRLTLTVTDVRVQRLQEISEEDAWAEGASRFESLSGPCNIWHGRSGSVGPCVYATARDSFRWLWNSIYGSDAWAANPWIVALTFTAECANIDAVSAPA